MEKKIEEIAKKFEFVLNLCDKFPDHMDLRHVVKTLKNDVTEILKDQTTNATPSLPTDEEISHTPLKQFLEAFKMINDSEALKKDAIIWAIEKKFIPLEQEWLRTNFSSEKCEGEAFGDWLLKNFDSGLYGWVRKKEAGKIYPACYNPPLSTIEVIEIFKNRNTNPPKQEQQTTK